MRQRLLSVNGLAAATGRDRRTITARLADVEPDATRGTARLYDLDFVIDVIMKDDSPRNELREVVNKCIAYEFEKPVDAVAAALRKVLDGQPPALVSKAVAMASIAQADAWRRMMAKDEHLQAAAEIGGARDADHLAQRLLKPTIAPKAKTSPRWWRFWLSRSIVEEIEKHGDVPAFITCPDE